MKHGSLFSGIGGFDLAAEWMGWENKFHCEWNEFCQKILKYYWPNAESYGDIDKTDFTIWRGRIDVLSGGFPCQPYSTAGKRKGKEDDRHKWPQMLRAIREIQPKWILGENVRGLTNWNGGLVFDEVQADLETEGYEVLPFLLPACGVNAPHRRDRIWFIAHSCSTRTGAIPGRCYQPRQLFQEGRWNENKQFDKPIGKSGIAADTTNAGYKRRHTSPKGQQHDARGERRCEPSTPGNLWNAANSEQQGREGRRREWSRFEQVAWDSWPTTEPLVRRGNDGLSSKLAGITFSKHRNESIKGYGNAIVPQVVYEIFKVIQQMENQLNHPRQV